MLLVESLLRGLAIGRALLCARLRHRVAVMDRYTVCQYASIRAHRRWHWRQGLGERLARAMYRPFPEPDVTFLLDVDPTEAYRRIEARGTDHENLDFLISSSQAYHELPEAKDFVLIDANSEADEVTHAILAVLTAANCPRKT
jgi:thymidylate kinase